MEKEKTSTKIMQKSVIILIIISTIVITGMLLSTIFALINVNNNKMMNGVSIEGIDVSNLSIEEATKKINTKLTEIINSDLKLIYKDDENIVKINEFQLQFNVQEAINEAYRIGRKDNIIINNYEILFTNLFKKNIQIDYKINDELTEKILNDIESKLEGVVEQSSYYIEGENLVITKGKSGIKMSKEKTKNDIKENIENKLKNQNEEIIKITVEEAKPEEINIQKVRDEIYKEPKDAYYTQNPFKIYPEEDGIDFAITIEEAQKIIDEEKDEYQIPLKFTSPNITVNQISVSAFPDTLSSFITKFDASVDSRKTNISLVAQAIDGKVVLPGQIFSFNAVVGNTTKEKGYKLATSYANGKMVQDYGGGTCQVSTTLYNAVLRANLEIVERRNHSYIVSYVDIGTDATIAYPTTDFKFKNTRNYAVKIVAKVTGGILQIDIIGVKEETEYEIIIDSKITQVIPFTTKTTKVNNLATGAQKVIVNGVNGYKSVTYKTTKLNGQVISKEIINQDTYKAMPREIQVGI